MSNQIYFKDEDLRDAIISHWAKQEGVTIDAGTASRMVQEVKAKIKNNTNDELKLALSELKLELSPTVASDNDVFTTSNLIVEYGEKLIKLAGWGDASREDIARVTEEIRKDGAAAGRTLAQQRKWIRNQKSKLMQKRDGIYQKLNDINNFDDEDADNQQEILSLINNNPELEQLINKEHSALPYEMGERGPVFKGRLHAGDSESKRVNYSPQEIELLNKTFWGKNSGKLESVGKIDRKSKKVTDRILWSRKRFAFEKALGKANTPLYMARLGYYQTYVVNVKAQAEYLSDQINDLERIQASSTKQNKMGGVLVTKVIEHFHIEAKEASRAIINNVIQQYQQELNNYKKEAVKYGQDSEQYKKVTLELQNLAEQEANKPVMASENNLNFDPEYLHNLSRKGGTYILPSKIGPSVWSVTPEGSVSSNPLEGTDVTWELGHAIYERKSKPSEHGQVDVNEIIKEYGEKKKVTQQFQENPYATEEQEGDFDSREESYVNGWPEGKKKKVAKSTANWEYLWNLAKQVISKGYAPKEEHYKQFANPNSVAVRNSVLNNTNTPDWVLMYSAETDTELGNLAEKKLGERGWVIKYDPATKKPKISADGSWIWKKKSGKTSSMKLSFREAQLAPTPIPPANQPAPTLTNPDAQTPQEIKQKQDQVLKDQQQGASQGGQQKPAVQGPDSTNAPHPPKALPFVPVASWNHVISKRDK